MVIFFDAMQKSKIKELCNYSCQNVFNFKDNESSTFDRIIAKLHLKILK